VFRTLRLLHAESFSTASVLSIAKGRLEPSEPEVSETIFEEHEGCVIDLNRKTGRLYQINDQFARTFFKKITD
jgi:hypothetical protein